MNESNIGQTIKSVVSILCVIGIIACVIAGIALISQGLGAIGWPVMLVGAFSLAVTYLFLYGFGELVDKTCANNAALQRIEKELEALKQGNREESQPAAAPEKAPARAQHAAAPAGSSTSKPERPAPQQPKLEVPVDPRESISEEMMSDMQEMKNAAEIYDYLSQKLDKSDKDTEEFLKVLARIVTNERLYGEDAYGAMAKVQAFAKHGCRVFAVDRSAPTMICPACGKEQDANRKACRFCGALFRQ